MATARSELIVENPPISGGGAVTLLDIGWEGFEAIAAIKGDRKYPRLIYADGCLTLVSPSLDEESSSVTLLDIGWEGFEAVAAMKGDRKYPRLIYAEGSLTLVSPSSAHERGGDRLDQFIKIICYELGVAYEATGATRYRRKDLERGIEGDKTYYIANEAVISENQEEVDLNVDPPPDLAIEVELTHPARDGVEIWRQLGVPEVWVHRPRRPSLTFLLLDPGRAYVESDTSRSFPFLSPSDVLGWIVPTKGERTLDWERRLRAWVRDELGPRMRRGGA